jgi:prepilin-type processing-associated H-X9-DG protein
MSRTRLVAVALLAALAGPPARAAALTPDLAAVPANAAAFVHIRVADLYHSDAFRPLRDTVAKAGQQALRAFNDRFEPAPESIDRITLVVLQPERDPHDVPPPLLVVATTTPVNRARLLAELGMTNTKETIGGIADEQRGVSVRFVDDRTFIVGEPQAMRRLAQAPRAAEHPLAPALALAAARTPVVAGANTSWLPAQAVAQAPPQLQPLLRAKLAMASVDLVRGTTIDVRLRYADARAASEAERAARAGLEMARQALAQGRAELEKKLSEPARPGQPPIAALPEAAMSLFGLGLLSEYDEMLRTLPLRTDGSDLRLNVTVPPGPASLAAVTSAVSVGLLLPAVQKVREAAARSKDANNLKQIGVAMHNYHAVNGSFPAHAIYSKDGKTPLLSWRVAILPYIEQDNLYKQFHLDEPWDSEHNQKLIEQMPQIYQLPTEGGPPRGGPGQTYYQVLVGGGALFDAGPKGPRLADITDGTSNTIMVAEGAAPVTWTKPDDLPYDPNKPLPKLGGHFPGGFNALFGDGSVRFLPQTIDEKTLRALITRAGGETIRPDF